MEMKDDRLTGNTEDENFNMNDVYDKFETDVRNVLINTSPSKIDM